MNNMPIGEILKEDGYITQEQLQQVLDYQKQSRTDKRVGELLIELGYITEIQKLEALGKRLNYPFVQLSSYEINKAAVGEISKSMANRYCAIPVDVSEGTITIAINDPLDFYAIENIEKATSKQADIILALNQEITDAIEYHYSEIDAKMAAMDINQSFEEEELDIFEDEFAKDEASDVPVVRLLNSLLMKGYSSNVSDIHIEPFERETKIRIRIDGMLVPYVTVTPNIHQSLVARTKILARLDIAEKRVPQDGHFKVKLEGVELNLRVSVIPTVFGEKVVLRYLNMNANMDNAGTFGMSKDNYDIFMRIMQNPNGIIYITGPTGSGKTTTLYMALEYFAQKPVNISTIEDPVERNLPHINQMQVNHGAGLTFGAGLRALLRQDPDIIMVGETRDNETALISTRAAVTGHLVLSTLHTNDAISTIVRLRDMGIEDYILSNSLVGVVAQRLARKICPNCMESYTPSQEETKQLGKSIPHLRRGTGCHMCNQTGYKGRIGVHEVIEIDHVVKKMIADNKPIDNIYQYMQDVRKMKNLRDSMRELVAEGVTSFEEFVRITYNV